MIPEMDREKLSIIQQKACKTYERNCYIRLLNRRGKNMAEIGRMFKLSRQTIRKIVSEDEGGIDG